MARGFTQYELGLAIGRRDGDISRWERGSLIPKVATLVQIATALGVSLDYLAGMTDDLVLKRTWTDPRASRSSTAPHGE